MKKIVYKIKTPSQMEVIFDNKRLLVEGEGTMTPMFYADINSLKCWESPFENTYITDKEKREIIEYITQESQKEGQIKIVFE